MDKAGAYSMTGYARQRAEAGGTAVTVTLKAVNHRFLDLRWQLPAELEGSAAGLEKRLRAGMRRGHVEVRVGVEWAEGSAGPQVRAAALAAYLAAFAEVAARVGMNAALPDPHEALRAPGVWGARGSEATEAELGGLAGEALERAIEQLNAARRGEGALLVADIVARLEALERTAAEIGASRVELEGQIMERLRERLRALAGELAPPERVLQEAALLAERGDISEELTRVEAHTRHARELLMGGGEVGKKLDFLTQELNREVNTLLSKTGSGAAAGLRITRLGLEMKAEVEKIKEQAQNLE